ncbi:hypothetical protein ACFC8F_10025 [Streptomyces hydrogenans]|uniref:hypothetical protein n=1 Tax=Streptomyces hydrogenans TaxID=1873719 RepID=UPI0035D831AE
MGESVSVHCPECRRSHAYAAPVFPCACGSPVAAPLIPDAPAEPIRHRTWLDGWVTVRCAACGREDEWPQPELGCACGTVLRIPVAPAGDPVGATAAVPEPAAAPEEGYGSERHALGAYAPDDSVGPGPFDTPPAPFTVPAPEAPENRHGGAEGADGGGDPSGHGDAPVPPVDEGAGDLSGHGSALGLPVDAGTGDLSGHGSALDLPVDEVARDLPARGGAPDLPGGEGAGEPTGDVRAGGRSASPASSVPPVPPVSDWFGAPPRSFAERYPAHIPLPPTAPRPAPARGAFRPVTIRTARDAVAAAATYLNWLGFREIVQPEDRHSSGVDLRGPGLVAQVDPSTRPAGLRAVECLWLNGLSASAVGIFFSLAGYTPEARSRAAEIGLPLFVLDLTGTPQPVNDAADELTSGGAI